MLYKSVEGVKMETISRVRAVGGSLMVTIPKEIARLESIQDGQVVKIEIKKTKKSALGIAKGMRAFTKEDEFDCHA